MSEHNDQEAVVSAAIPEPAVTAVVPEPEVTAAAPAPEILSGPGSEPAPQGPGSAQRVVQALIRESQQRLLGAMREPLEVEITRMPGFDWVPLPDYKHDGDAGMNLYTAFDDAERLVYPGDQVIWPTGLQVSLPRGVVGLVVPRSGKTLNCRLVVANTPGIIDAPYRGPLQLLVENRNPPKYDPKGRRLDEGVQRVKRGEAIAQLLVVPVLSVRWKLVDAFSDADTTRGAGGFGSTG